MQLNGIPTREDRQHTLSSLSDEVGRQEGHVNWATKFSKASNSNIKYIVWFWFPGKRQPLIINYLNYFYFKKTNNDLLFLLVIF